MKANFWIAQIIGFVASLINVSSMQFNKKKQIMFCNVLANFLHATNLFLLGGYSASIINIVAGLQTLINYLFDEKQKTVPAQLIIIYLLVSVSLAGLAVVRFIDVIPIICAVLYISLITVQKENMIRRLTLYNEILWLVYDMIIENYFVALFDFFIMLSTLVGIYRYDIKKKGENK